MLIFRIIGIGITGAVSAVLLKQYRRELAIAVSVITVCIMAGLCIPYLSAVISLVRNIANQAGINPEHIKIILKIIGVAYACQFASDICADAGETSISGKIELGGKIVILTMSMPVIYGLLEVVNKIINY